MMGIELLDTRLRIALVAAAIILAIAAFAAVRRRRPGVGAALGTGAFLAIAALVAEILIAATVRLAASGRADFNEFRWVLLSPWGRVGLGLGAATVAAIGVLAWRSTRGITTWRRALILGLRGGAAMTALFLFLEPAIELRQVAREPNRIAVLIDDSASMNLAETKAGPRRIERARALLAASSEALAAWTRDHRVDVYTFSDTVAAATGVP